MLQRLQSPQTCMRCPDSSPITVVHRLLVFWSKTVRQSWTPMRTRYGQRFEHHRLSALCFLFATTSPVVLLLSQCLSSCAVATGSGQLITMSATPKPSILLGFSRVFMGATMFAYHVKKKSFHVSLVDAIHSVHAPWTSCNLHVAHLE